MLTVRLVCIGKLKETYLKEAQAEYEKRLKSLCRFTLIELAEYKLGNDPSPAEIDRALLEESTAILEKSRGYLIPLCIEGQELSSIEFSDKVQRIALHGVSEITFVIGGSFGLSDAVKTQADYCLSLSKMTFPHQLFRVIFLEQLYRAFQISANTKYHK